MYNYSNYFWHARRAMDNIQVQWASSVLMRTIKQIWSKEWITAQNKQIHRADEEYPCIKRQHDHVRTKEDRQK